MNIGNRLAEIWKKDYINAFPFIKDRGYAFADNVKKDILITGFNPSFRDGDTAGVVHGPISEIWYDEKYDNYWGPIRKIINDDGIDLRNNADYLDIFYFREKDQQFLNDKILSHPNGIRFLVDQLNLTMHIIEDVVKPKLLVIKNKDSWAYFGRLFEDKGWVWMGYQFEHIQNMACGELCRIKGLLNSKERIAPEILQTNLVGSFALFTNHINQYTSLKERPNSKILKSILDLYNAELEIRSYSI